MSKRILTASEGNTLAKLSVESSEGLYTVDCWLQAKVYEGTGEAKRLELRTIPGVACVVGVAADTDGGAICQGILAREEGDEKADAIDMTVLLDWLAERDGRFDDFRGVILALKKAARLYKRPGSLTILR